MRKYLLLVIVMLLAQLSHAQDFSNKGKEFWLAYSYHVGMAATSSGAPTMTLNMTSDVNTNYTIEIYGGTVISTGSITAGVATIVTIPTTYFVNGDGLYNGRAIHVTALKPIVIYAFQTRTQATGATLCLPQNVLGKQYYGMSFTQNSNEQNANSYITIVAVEDNTNVEIIPTAATVGGWTANSVHTITLNKGQVYQVLGTTTGNNGVDLSGTSVRSVASGTGGCKRIAVFSGSGKLALGCSGSSADNLYQQLYPVASWGKKYLTVPSYSRLTNYYRVMRSDPATVLKVNGVVIPSSSFTNGYYQFVNATPNLIEADLPVSVTQYFTSQGCTVPGYPANGSPYDPDMIVLNPVEQNISYVTLVSSNLTGAATAHQHHIHVIMKNGGTGISSFRFDGAVLPATSTWAVDPQDPTYSYTYITNVSESSNGQPGHTLQSDSGFNAIAYGYSNAETYAYSAGTNVKDLYQQIGVTTQYGIEPLPSVCAGSPFRFKISLPYQPLQLLWDLHNLPGSTLPSNNSVTQNPSPGACATLSAPNDATYVCHDSTTIVNGKTIYWYSINAYYTVNAIGAYDINIIAQTDGVDGCGSTQEIPFTLNVYDPPIADFTFTSPGCVAEQVTFHDNTTSVKPNYHWYWDFGDPGSGAANFASTANPVHTFSTPGVHNVRFSSITTPGCLSDTLTKTITVPDMPDGNISGTIAVCQNATAPQITFTATPGPSPYTYSHPPYTFTYHVNSGGNQTVTTTGTSLTVSIPVAAANLATPGTYTYYLTNVSNAPATLCTKNITNQMAIVTVNPLPTATVSGTTAVCQNSSAPIITFTGATGTAPYTFTYHIGTGADQTVTTTSGNSITVPVSTTVIGTYTYTLTSVADASSTVCSNTITGQSATVTVNELPTAGISGSTEVCLNATSPNILFTAIGGVAPYTFTYNINAGANQTVTTISGASVTVPVPTTTAGAYVYHLISVQESSSTTCLNAQTGTATVIVDPKPTASFTTTAPYCESRDITFTPTFGVSSGSVVSWVWDYGDGTGSHIRPDGLPFTVNYATAGIKTVTFAVVSDKGCESTVITQNITVNSKPKAGFISPEVCLLDPFAQFTDTSTVAAPGTITAWEWNFADPNATPGNPNTSNAQNPTHIYTVIGNYNVQLISTSNFGCKDTVLQVVTISDGNPQSNFVVLNPGGLCSNDSVAIQNKSTIGSGNITKLQIYWDFGNQPAVFDLDNVPFFDKIYKHKYNPTTSVTQTYIVRVSAYSGGLCFSTKDITITVHGAPAVQFNTIPDVCLNNGTVQFTQASETGGVAGTGVYSGTGVTAGGLFDPLVAGVGTHLIKYTYTSAFGCVDSLTKPVIVLAAPVAVFAQGNVTCQNATTTFTEASTAAAGNIVQWLYHWGDGTPDQTFTTGGTRTHTYTMTGTVTANLVVTTDYGCKSLPTPITFTVNPQPLPNFTFTNSACLPQAKIDFVNTTPNMSDWTYNWNFDVPSTDPGDQGTGTNPPHIYTSLGVHNVQLTATSATGTGCTNSIIKNVASSIHPAPFASFDFNKTSICAAQNVTVIDHSTFADGTATSWSWNYGDNSTGTGQIQPPHIYNADGIYQVTLNITNSFGCKDDTMRAFTVYPYPTVNAGPDQFILEGGQATIPASATGNDLQYLWTSSVGNTYLNSNTVLQPIIHPVVDLIETLTVTARGGCAKSDNVFIKVLKFPQIPNTFTPNSDGIHDTWEIKYLFTYPDNRVQVFTRTGQLVFESKGYAQPWNGTKNNTGPSLPFDTYYYIIEPGSGRAPITGYVTIVK